MTKWVLLASVCVAAVAFSAPAIGQDVSPNPPPAHRDKDKCFDKEDLIDGFDEGLTQEIDNNPETIAVTTDWVGNSNPKNFGH